VKPLRGKRVDPQSRPGEFNLSLSGGGRLVLGIRKDPPGVRPSSTSALSSGRAPRPVSDGGHKPDGKVTCHPCGGRCYSPSSVDSSRDRGFAAPRLLSALCVRSTGEATACSSLRPRAWICREATGCHGSVANRSVLHPTRLETRTKESNMCASHGVLYET
jgi:hypothetical protein